MKPAGSPRAATRHPADVERDVIKVDIPVEEWEKGDCVTIYITGQRVVNNTFYKLICQGKVNDNCIKSCNKDGIIQFTHEKCNRIIYHPDCYMLV